MESYLVIEFGLSSEQAAVQARHAVDDIVAAHLLIPKDYVGGEHNWFGDHRPVIDLKLLDPNSRPDRVAPAMTPLSGLAEEDFAPTLFKILDDPRARSAYLAQASDKEAANLYGKTLLMFAAHLNQLDAVKDLLAAGADVNAATSDRLVTFSCNTALKRTGRTPLMYAAENASFEVMDALVAAGAHANATDSTGMSVDVYLSRNPRLARLGAPTPHTVNEALQRFHKSPVTNEPSFSCAGSLSDLEKIICADPVAALYDREMASSFTAWKAKTAGEDNAVADQLDWLRRRNRSCGAMEGADAKRLCLQEMLRARSRYIENRLAE